MSNFAQIWRIQMIDCYKDSGFCLESSVNKFFMIIESKDLGVSRTFKSGTLLKNVFPEPNNFSASVFCFFITDVVVIKFFQNS